VGTRFGLGLAAGLLVGTAAGAGGILGWQGRPTAASEPEATAAVPAPADPPPLPTPQSPAPLPKPPDPPPAGESPAPAGPPTKDKTAEKDRPNPFRPGGPPPPLVLDNPDGETRPIVRPGGHLVLAGKVKRLVIPGLQAGAVLDASRLEAGEVVVAGPIDGRARLIVRAPAGLVRFRGKVDGGSVVEVTARTVGFDEPIGGPETRAVVTLTSGGELTFAAVGGSSRLEYRRANPGDPAPKLIAGRVVPPGIVAEVP
jgi:hypothetical protein